MRAIAGRQSVAWVCLTMSLILVSAGVPAVTAQQQRMKPTAPGTPGDPKWQRHLRLSDGRTFVTDGGLALDAALAKPATLPGEVLSSASSKVLEGYMAAKRKDECSVSELKKAANGRSYTSPTGIGFNATYIDYLRRILPAASLRFRMEAHLDPVVIVSNGTVVGVLMPVAR